MKTANQFALFTVLAAIMAFPAYAQQASQQQRSFRDGQGASARERQGADQQRASRRDEQAAQRQTRVQVAGEVVNSKRVDVRGTDRQHFVALLKTDRGKRVIVDFGPPGRLGRNLPGIGDRIAVQGRVKQIGDRSVVIADQLRADGQVVRIDHRRTVARRQQQVARRQDQQDPRRDQQDRRQQQAQRPRVSLGLALVYNPQTDRLHVVRVQPGGPAERAGIQPGDVILLVNDRDVTAPQDLLQALERMTPGQQATLIVLRDGQRRTAQAQTASRRQVAGSQPRRQDQIQRGQSENAPWR